MFGGWDEGECDGGEVRAGSPDSIRRRLIASGQAGCRLLAGRISAQQKTRLCRALLEDCRGGGSLEPLSMMFFSVFPDLVGARWHHTNETKAIDP